MQNLLERLEKYVLYAVVFLLPIIFLPALTNPTEPVKLIVLVYGLGLVLLLKVLRVVTTGKMEMSSATFDFPVLLVVASFLASALMRTPNKMDAFFLPGTATAVVFGGVLYYLLNQLGKTEKTMAKMLLLMSGFIFSLIVLFSGLNIFSKIPQLPAFMKLISFNPAGGLLPASIFLAALLPLGVGMLISEKSSGKKAVMGVGLGLISVALVVAVFNMLPGKTFSPRFPSAGISWSIAVDSLKASPLLGVGPGNYVTAFSRFRPISFNSTDLWAVRFATAHDFYLTTFTEVGLLGVAGLVLLLLSFYRFVKGNIAQLRSANWGLSSNSSLISLVALFVLLALFPATNLILAVLFIFLAFVSETKKTSMNLASTGDNMESSQVTQKVASKLPALLVSVPVVVIVLFVWIRGARIVSAEVLYKKALDRVAANDVSAYDLLRNAINTNPQVDRYHITYAQVNLAIANSIAQTPADQITDQDRSNISQLIQQAIQAGKNAVALNPLRAANWEILGRIYQALIPFAQGADTFATQTLSQAVALDPINPNTRVALGGVYYGQGNYTQAIRVFELATVAKADHANAHYNLAFALRENGQIDEAISEMSVVLSLVDKNTTDYETAKAALEDLQTRKAASTQAASGQELTAPQAGQEPVLKPPLELPEESAPPEAPIISPSPTPTPEEGSGNLTPTPTEAP